MISPRATVCLRLLRHGTCSPDLLVRNVGTGGESIYGEKFEDEAFPAKHTRPFLLSMVRRSPCRALSFSRLIQLRLG